MNKRLPKKKRNSKKLSQKLNWIVSIHTTNRRSLDLMIVHITNNYLKISLYFSKTISFVHIFIKFIHVGLFHLLDFNNLCLDICSFKVYFMSFAVFKRLLIFKPHLLLYCPLIAPIFTLYFPKKQTLWQRTKIHRGQMSTPIILLTIMRRE